jgi:hypothetical protein
LAPATCTGCKAVDAEPGRQIHVCPITLPGYGTRRYLRCLATIRFRMSFERPHGLDHVMAPYTAVKASCQKQRLGNRIVLLATQVLSSCAVNPHMHTPPAPSLLPVYSAPQICGSKLGDATQTRGSPCRAQNSKADRQRSAQGLARLMDWSVPGPRRAFLIGAICQTYVQVFKFY